MPPLKTFIFTHEVNKIEVTIQAYNDTHAYDMLYSSVKEPTKYKLGKLS